MSDITPPPPSSSTPPPPAGWGEDPPRPRLARRRTDKVLGGVCGGLADHLGVDVVAVRVVAVLLAMTGWGVLLYLVAWCALPVADPNAPPPPRAHRGPGRGRFPWLPVAIVAVLLFTLPSGFSVIAGHGGFGNAFVPIFLLGGAAYLMWRATRGELPRPGSRRGAPGGGPGRRPGWADPRAAGWQAPPPPADAAPAAPTVASFSTAAPDPGPAPGTTTERPLWARDDDDDDEDAASPAAPTGPAGAAGKPGEQVGGDDDPLLAEARRLSDPFLNEPLLFETAPAEVPAASPTAPASARRGGGARSVLAALLIGAGVVGLAVALGVTFTPFALLAGALVALGVAMIFGGLGGRSRRGLIIPALIVFGLLSVTSLVDLPNASAGERVYEPDKVSEIHDTYALGLGEMVIDLSDVEFSAGDDVDITAEMGAGELRVYVPEEVDVVVHASAGAGELHAFGETQEGINPRLVVEDAGSRESGEITLDLDLSLGEIRVERA